MPRMSVVMPIEMRAWGLAAALGFAAVLGGCAPRTLETPAPAPAGPSYTGPAYLRGTVGSLARLRNNQALPVSGYGLVVGLHGTGDRGAPAYIRQFLLNEMRKQGVGSVKTLGILPTTPERMLDSTNTAVVAVEGLIPPGATKGTRFDLLISALPATQTTSLAGGRLYMTNLALGGANPANRYSRPLAEGRGPVYVNPFDSRTQQEKATDFRRQAMIVGGGEVTEDRKIEIVLNQPSWQRARAVEDRINERFPMGADDRAHKTANAVSNLVIRIEVPKRYIQSPENLLALIAHLYINNAPQFEPMMARRLYEELRDDPTKAQDVVLAWKALGRTIIPILREHYQSDETYIRFAALEAGAYLQDEKSSQYLLELAGSEDPAVRARVARSLTNLPSSLRGSRALKQLLDDQDITVRLAAYEALARIGDPIIERMAVRDEGGIKFLIDRIPSKRPLIYVTYHGLPRIVIFNERLGFDEDQIARLWDNRLMLRKPETLAQSTFGLKIGGSVYVPIVRRSKIEEIGSPRWQASITDAAGEQATLIIESKDLCDRFAKKVSQSGDQPQAVVIAQFIDREIDEQTFQVTRQFKLVDVRDADIVRPLMVYYQPLNKPVAETYKIAPNVATLTYLLATKRTRDNPQDGLDLTYSQVVDALYHLCKKGYIEAPIEVDTTPLAALIDAQTEGPVIGPRPETGDAPTDQGSEPAGAEPPGPPEPGGVVPVQPGRAETAAR